MGQQLTARHLQQGLCQQLHQAAHQLLAWLRAMAAQQLLALLLTPVVRQGPPLHQRQLQAAAAAQKDPRLRQQQRQPLLPHLGTSWCEDHAWHRVDHLLAGWREQHRH